MSWTYILFFIKLQQEKFEDAKWVIRTGKSKNRQYNEQKKMDKGSTNYLQNITQKTNDWTTGTTLRTGVNTDTSHKSFCINNGSQS